MYILIDVDMIRIVEAKAWIRKYLIADSARKGHNLVVINGIKESRLSSNPSQDPNQDVEEIERAVPVNNVEKNNK